MSQINMMDQEINIPEKMNIFQRIGKLLFSPSKLFSFTRNKPTVLFPIILICIGAVLVQLLLWEPSKNMALDLMYNTYKNMGKNVSPAEIEQLLNASMILVVATSPIYYIGIWLVVTLVLYLIFRLVKCEKGLKKYFSMTGYIMVLSMLGALLNAGFIYVTGSDFSGPAVTSLASLLDPDIKDTFLYGLVSQIEVFNLWTFALYGIGFVYTGGVEKKKSYLLTTILAVIVIVASAGLSLLSTGLQNNLLGNIGGF